VHVAAGGSILAGNNIAATAAGGVLTFTLDAGGVAELVAPAGRLNDPSGSLVLADKPVQVITGIGCTNVPQSAGSCDHVEESVPPAEALGKHYLVTVPTGPNGKPIGHLVRIYGNSDGTHLTYSGIAPSACGPTVGAGQVLDCAIVTADFEVLGDHEFSVASFMEGSSVVDPGKASGAEGDPSQTVVLPMEQYESRYAFFANPAYDVTFLDVAAPLDTALTLDGAPVNVSLVPLVGGTMGVARIPLKSGASGAHSISGDKPFGAQVVAYTPSSSYAYPVGLSLAPIAPPPPR
jgi:hypothetical protein